MVGGRASPISSIIALEIRLLKSPKKINVPYIFKYLLRTIISTTTYSTYTAYAVEHDDDDDR